MTTNTRSTRLFLLSFCAALCASLAPLAHAADADKAKATQGVDGKSAPASARDKKEKTVAEPPGQTPGKADINNPKAAQASTEGQPSLLEESDSTANAKKERADKAAQKKAKPGPVKKDQ